jgi:hypothetical protein
MAEGHAFSKLVRRAAARYEQIDDLLYLVRKASRVLVSDSLYIRAMYVRAFGRTPDLKRPMGFNEKLQWMKLYWRDPTMQQVVDKYEVRSFVESRVGRSALNELYGVYLKIDEISAAALPTQFVLKATHGSGYNVICADKTKLDWAAVRRKFTRWMSRDYSLYGREWAYQGVSPRIVCEKFLSGRNGEAPRDYKFFCFGGCPKFVQVDYDRFGVHRRNFYDMQWRLQPFRMTFPNTDFDDAPPTNFDEMVEMACRLSEGFPFVRVDLYSVEGRASPVFGELTFYPDSGLKPFDPPRVDQEIGCMLKLPDRQIT